MERHPGLPYWIVEKLLPMATICCCSLLSAARALCIMEREVKGQAGGRALAGPPRHGRFPRNPTFSRSLSAANLLFSSCSASSLLLSSFCSFSRCFLAAFCSRFFSAFFVSISAVSGPGILDRRTRQWHALSATRASGVTLATAYLRLAVVVLVRVLRHVLAEHVAGVLLRGNIVWRPSL